MTYRDDLSQQLLGGRIPLPRNGNTGITGGGLSTKPLETPGLQAPAADPTSHLQGLFDRMNTPLGGAPGGSDTGPAPAAPRPQNFGYLGGGFSHDKLNDPNHKTSKYLVGRTLSQFDPGEGLTPAVLAALNELGLAEFYGSGDKGGYRNVTDAGRAAGIKDDGTSGDWIKNFSGEGAKTWRYAAPGQAQRDAGGQHGSGMAGRMGGPVSMQGGLAGLLTGNPTSAITAALAQQGEQGGYLQSLLRQLGVR